MPERYKERIALYHDRVRLRALLTERDKNNADSQQRSTVQGTPQPASNPGRSETPGGLNVDGMAFKVETTADGSRFLVGRKAL